MQWRMRSPQRPSRIEDPRESEMRRRSRPGLLGTVGRTAVVAGTATATANAVNRHAQNKAAEKEQGGRQ